MQHKMRTVAIWIKNNAKLNSKRKLRSWQMLSTSAEKEKLRKEKQLRPIRQKKKLLLSMSLLEVKSSLLKFLKEQLLMKSDLSLLLL